MNDDYENNDNDNNDSLYLKVRVQGGWGGWKGHLPGGQQHHHLSHWRQSGGDFSDDDDDANDIGEDDNNGKGRGKKGPFTRLLLSRGRATPPPPPNSKGLVKRLFYPFPNHCGGAYHHLSNWRQSGCDVKRNKPQKYVCFPPPRTDNAHSFILLCSGNHPWWWWWQGSW